MTTGKIGTVLSVGVYGHHSLYLHRHLARADVLMGYVGGSNNHGRDEEEHETSQDREVCVFLLSGADIGLWVSSRRVVRTLYNAAVGGT